MAKIFVSYARKESEKVYSVLSKLEEHDIKFWLDTRDIENGKDWAEEISKAIKKCGKFLLFLSRLSMASNNTSQEVKIASGSHKKIIILRLDDAKLPDKLKYALEGIQWTDRSSPKWKSEIVSALSGGQKLLLKPSTSTNKPIHSLRTRIVKPLSPQAIISELEGIFSANRKYYPDECKKALTKLYSLRSVIGYHWVNPSLAYTELIPRAFLLEKIEIIQNLIEDFQNSCPPGLPIKRQTIQHELRALLSEIGRKT